MPRLRTEGNPLGPQAFALILDTPVEFSVKELYNAIRTGVQDLLQEADINASVTYSLTQLPAFREPDGSVTFDPSFATAELPEAGE